MLSVEANARNARLYQGCSNFFYGGPDKVLFLFLEGQRTGARGQNDDTYVGGLGGGACLPGNFLKLVL